MATQTEIKKLNQVVEVKKFNWNLVLGAFAVLLLFGGVVLVWQVPVAKSESNYRALEAISTRYEGMAQAYADIYGIDTQKALSIISDRYQGMFALQAAGEKEQAQRALQLISTRYQARAVSYLTGIQSENTRALQIISDRYQALADRYLALGK